MSVDARTKLILAYLSKLDTITAKEHLTMDSENSFDDNGLQHAFLLTSWQENASSDGISENDAEDCQPSHCDTIPTRGAEEESTAIATGERKSYKAVPLSDKGGIISARVPPQSVSFTNVEESGKLIRPTKHQKVPKRSKGLKHDLVVPACSIAKKEEAEDVDGKAEIRAIEVEGKDANFRSGRSAKDGGCLKSIMDLDIYSSLAYFWAIAWTKISCQFSASLAIGILLLMPSVGVGGDLTSVPVNSLVVVGNTVRINCSTYSNQPVYWARILARSNEQQWLYYGGDGFDSNNADGRFRIDEDEATGRYDLIIDDVKQKDAGQYVCVGESGIGEKATAELVVSDPINCKSHIPIDGVMGYNVFYIKQDFIQFSCNLTYTGNLLPNLEWTWPGSDEQSDERYVSAAKSFVASTIKLSPSKEHNSLKFQCKANVEGTTQQTIDSGLLWESETIIVKYAEFTPEEADTCPGVEWNLVCNPQCSYSFEETKDHECRCMYTYYDKRTRQNYQVASYAVTCAKDNVRLLVVLIPVAVVITTLVITAVAVTCCRLKKKERKNGFQTRQPLVANPA